MYSSKIVNFGDVIIDPDNDLKYVVVNATTGVNGRKQYLQVLEVTEQLNCVATFVKPHERASIRKFRYHSNIKDHLIPYLEAMKIRYCLKTPSSYGFSCKR